jgi:hypothetical protein
MALLAELGFCAREENATTGTTNRCLSLWSFDLYYILPGHGRLVPQGQPPGFRIVGTVDMLSSVNAAAFSMAMAAGGACKNVKATPLLTIAEAQDAMKKAATCGYTPATKATGA